MKKIVLISLALAFFSAWTLAATGRTGSEDTPAKPAPTTAAAQEANPPSSTPAPSSVRPQSTTQRRSYQRETHTHRKSSISKGEIVFMAAIAGTSMGIGALAAGGEGVAIGAIVGGWGAYVGHRVWNWVK